jgi:hypothetical protein
MVDIRLGWCKRPAWQQAAALRLGRAIAQVKELLAAVAKKEGLTLPQPLADRIAAAAKRDMRRALLSLEVQPCSHTLTAVLRRGQS